jgi:hypothetical protein
MLLWICCVDAGQAALPYGHACSASAVARALAMAEYCSAVGQAGGLFDGNVQQLHYAITLQKSVVTIYSDFQ